MAQLDGEIMSGGWYLLAGVVQLVVIALRLFGVVTWPWWLVLLPVEAVGVGAIVLVVYLMTTKGNPFQ